LRCVCGLCWEWLIATDRPLLLPTPSRILLLHMRRQQEHHITNSMMIISSLLLLRDTSLLMIDQSIQCLVEMEGYWPE